MTYLPSPKDGQELATLSQLPLLLLGSRKTKLTLLLAAGHHGLPSTAQFPKPSVPARSDDNNNNNNNNSEAENPEAGAVVRSEESFNVSVFQLRDMTSLTQSGTPYEAIQQANESIAAKMRPKEEKYACLTASASTPKKRPLMKLIFKIVLVN